MENMMGAGAPEGVIDEIFEAVKQAESIDDMFGIFAEEYSRIAEFYMNLE
jgi:hypothetical protein